MAKISKWVFRNCNSLKFKNNSRDFTARELNKYTIDITVELVPTETIFTSWVNMHHPFDPKKLPS
jgi:hypothetical protein